VESPPPVGRTAAAPPAAPAPLDTSLAASPATPPVDSAAIRARRDSATAAARGGARADSLTSEREAIRREIERRRARIDSILRAQGGSATPP
jgi:hypothetical protein